MLSKVIAAVVVLSIVASVAADITHWVSEPYQSAVVPGSDSEHLDFNDGSYWTVDLMVTISGDDDWTSTGQFEADFSGGQFFCHELGERAPPPVQDVSIYPALEFDTMFLSTEPDGTNQPPQADPPFAGNVDCDPQNMEVEVWHDVPPNGRAGDFVIARFTVKRTDTRAILTLEGDSTTVNYGGELLRFFFEVPIERDCNNNGIGDWQDLMNCDGRGARRE